MSGCRINTDNLDCLCRGLAEYRDQSMKALQGSVLTPIQAQELVLTIENIRMQLSELLNAPNQPDVLLEIRQSVAGLYESYLELEGAAKEKRNDLSGNGQGPARTKLLE